MAESGLFLEGWHLSVVLREPSQSSPSKDLFLKGSHAKFPPKLAIV
jgi:hypothetical protein